MKPLKAKNKFMKGNHSISGALDTAKFNLEKADENICSALESGEVRMKHGEIRSAKKYLKTILAHARNIHLALAEFEMIAPPEKVIEEKTHE